MHAALQQIAERRVDQAMARKRRQAQEPGRADDDVEMSALACAGVPDMENAVVADLEQVGLQRLLQPLADFGGPIGAHEGGAAAESRALRRLSQTVCAIKKSRVSPVMPYTLKLTQVDCG